MDYKIELLKTVSKQCESLAKENNLLKSMLSSVGINCANCSYFGWCKVTYSNTQDIDKHVCTKFTKKKVKKVKGENK